MLKNTTSVDTTLGGGHNGYLGLVLTTEQYNQVVLHTNPLTDSWTNPVNPGAHPNVPPNATAPQIMIPCNNTRNENTCLQSAVMSKQPSANNSSKVLMKYTAALSNNPTVDTKISWSALS